MIRMLLMMIVMCIPIGIYLYILLGRLFKGLGIPVEKRSVKIIRIILLVILVLLSVNFFSTTALIILHILACALVVDIVQLFIRRRQKKKGAEYRVWTKIYRCLLVPVLMTAVIIAYGYFNMGNIIETNYSVDTVKTVRKDGYKIALISDLHFGTTMSVEKLQSICDKIESESPDLVVLDGDIVDEKTTKQEMENTFRTLGSIQSEWGTFYVYGNHDSVSYSSSPNFTVPELDAAITSNGITMLKDEAIAINDEFTIVGRLDRGFSGKSGRKTPEQLLQNVDKSDFILMLDHQPVELQTCQEAGVDLELSGHTHAGQIWPVGLISDILGFGELNYGERKTGNYTAIVTSGIAGWGYPVRTGAHSEYVTIQVR